MPGGPWPELPFTAWRETAATLHLWTQIAGKVRLGLTPWVNHSWQVPLYVTARGLGTSAMPAGHELLELEFDLVDHRLRARMSTGKAGEIVLAPITVADFYAQLRDMLHSLGVGVAISDMPSEIAEPVRFSQDRVHAAYDPGAARDFWRVLIQADRVMKLFRSGFLGKVSPVHFFWGSFDLAVTRFSGRPAPRHPGGIPGLPDPITREAYSHEVSSAGFWPGNEAFPEAAFYSYAYPAPPGSKAAKVTADAYFHEGFGEFILPYDTLRSASDPDGLLLDFLMTTYAAAADLGGWDRRTLECGIGAPGVVRPV